MSLTNWILLPTLTSFGRGVPNPISAVSRLGRGPPERDATLHFRTSPQRTACTKGHMIMRPLTASISLAGPTIPLRSLPVRRCVATWHSRLPKRAYSVLNRQGAECSAPCLSIPARGCVSMIRSSTPSGFGPAFAGPYSARRLAEAPDTPGCSRRSGLGRTRIP